jgi:hypothetical protein
MTPFWGAHFRQLFSKLTTNEALPQTDERYRPSGWCKWTSVAARTARVIRARSTRQAAALCAVIADINARINAVTTRASRQVGLTLNDAPLCI